MLLSMRSVQRPEEWGQRAKISVAPRDIELGGVTRSIGVAGVVAGRGGRVELVKRESSKSDFTGTTSYSSVGTYGR
jgi:hypothetical protein